MLQVLVLGLDRFEAFAPQGGGLGVADGVLNCALATGEIANVRVVVGGDNGLLLK